MGTAGRTHDNLLGRGPELALLTQCVRDGQICYLHGLPGIGKSLLLDTLARRAQADGACVIALDCRAVEPTERGFLHAIDGLRDVKDLVAHLSRFDDPVVVVLDHYEVFRLMDTWLRQTLVPALPPGVALVFGSRERPCPAGSASPASARSRFRRSPRPTPGSCSHRGASRRRRPRG